MNIDSILPCTTLLLFSMISCMLYCRAKTGVMKIFTSLLLGSVFAILAYHFVPHHDYDLVRHYQNVQLFQDADSVNELIEIGNQNKQELFPTLYGFVVGSLGDLNLLQSVLAFVGYSLLFYILIDYKEIKRLDLKKFFPLVMLTVFGQHIIFYFSGLYNYFAIVVFAYALYLDYIKGLKKIPHFLYLSTVLVHSSMVFPLVILYLLKLKKNSISIRFIGIIVLVLLMINVLLGPIVDFLNIVFLNNVKQIYDTYVQKNSSMIGFYDGMYLFMTITKLALVLLACWIQRSEKENKGMYNYTVLLAIAVIVLSIYSIAITRFSSLVLFAGFPIISDAIQKHTKLSCFLYFAMVGISVLYAIYAIYSVVMHINLGGII